MMKRIILLVSCVVGLFTGPALAGDGTESGNVIRIMTVVICQQDGFLQFLLDPWLKDRDLHIEYRTGHHTEVARAVKNGEADIVMAHTKVKKMQKMAERGRLREGRALFANPKTFLGPQGDPAGITGLTDAVQAMHQIQERGYCYVINPHGRLAQQQVELLEPATPTKACVFDEAQDTPSALALATDKGAYTLWGLHPYIARGDGKLQPVVVPDQRLLENIGGWIVNDSAVTDESHELLDYLSSAEVRARIATFRLQGHDSIQPWWPPVDK